MATRGFFSGFLTLVVAGAFAAGLFAPELRAQGGLPEALSSLRTGGGDSKLSPRNTYNRVLQLIREKYYGEVRTEMQMTYTAISGLLNTLDDPYTRFLDPSGYRNLKEENTGEFEGIGAQLSSQPTKEGYIRIFRPLTDGPADQAGIRKGDLITKVDGKTVVGKSVDEAVKIIRGKAGTPVHLTILRGKEEKQFTIVRKAVEFEVVTSEMKESGIGYVSLQQFNEMADPKIDLAVRKLKSEGMKGLILDLRGNPGGLLDAAIDVSSRFIPPNRGVVIIVESQGQQETRKTNGRKYLLSDGFPLVVLVNRTSASASEIVSGAVKDNKAGRIIGTTTFGKGLVQTVVPLSDGSACMITTAKYLTPSGKDINRSREQRGGVEPDEAIEVSEEEFFQGKDPQLRRALEYLRDRIGQRAASQR